jgi:hypothetical protein
MIESASVFSFRYNELMINHASKSDQSLRNLQTTSRITTRSFHLYALSLLSAAFFLAACSSLPDDATPTLAATAEVVQATTIAETPAPLPSETPQPATIVPAATIPPTIPPTTCLNPLQPDLSAAWYEAELGCPARCRASADQHLLRAV